MVVSIQHRITGSILALLGIPASIWWFASIVGGENAYADFADTANSPLGVVVLLVLSWAFFAHLLSGVRHFVMDIGAGLEVQTNKRWSIAVLVLAPLAAAAFWFVVGVR